MLTSTAGVTVSAAVPEMSPDGGGDGGGPGGHPGGETGARVLRPWRCRSPTTTTSPSR